MNSTPELTTFALSAASLPAIIENPVIASLIKVVVVLSIILGLTGYIVLFERRVIAWLQHRVGPNRAGPFGMLHPISDTMKLFFKEDYTPPFVDKFLFVVAPAIIAITGLVSFGLIPWGDPRESHWYIIADSNVGVLLFLALSSLAVYSIVLAGWGSNNKYAMIGGLRATAQMISYELSMSLSLLGVVVMVGSLRLNDIVLAQENVWFILLQPIGFIIFLISAVAESRRTPFDLPEAENELVAGFHTEYSSMKFAMFFLGEYIGVLLLSAIIATMYLGGWRGPYLPLWGLLAIGAAMVVYLWWRAMFRPKIIPVLLLVLIGVLGAVLWNAGLLAVAAPGFVWLLIKIGLLLFFFVWIRATYPRFRYDHLMNIGWKWMVPLSIINLVVTAVVALALHGRQ